MDLVELLNNGLPLDRVGPHLRHAVRKALRQGDRERMAIVARVVVSEMLRRGDLLRVSVQGGRANNQNLVLVNGQNQVLDLSVLGHFNQSSISQSFPSEIDDLELGGLDMPMAVKQPEEGPEKEPEKPSPAEVPAEPQAGLTGLTSVLGAMEESQKMDLGDPRSSEDGVILGSILELLDKFTPQFEMQILLFKEYSLHDYHSRVFSPDQSEILAPWFENREKGHSVWLSDQNQLPQAIQNSFSDSGEGSIQTALAVPLFSHQPRGSGLVDREEAGLLFLMADQIWSQDTMLRLASRLSRFVTTRWQQHKEVSKQIHVDKLTGLFNKGYFQGQLGLLMERARRNNAPLTLVYCDIDHFKVINDTYGHHNGDKALRMVARRLQEELRRIDQVCRWGGEEFTLILPDTDVDAAMEVMQRLLNASFIETITYRQKPMDLKITLSYGVATFPDCASDQQELDRKADTIMYLSKDRGRNQCHFWSNDGNHLQMLPESSNP